MTGLPEDFYDFSRDEIRWGGTYSEKPGPTISKSGSPGRRTPQEQAAKSNIFTRGIDPGVARKEERREKATARPFASWADERFAKQEAECGERTMKGKRQFVGYLKDQIRQLHNRRHYYREGGCISQDPPESRQARNPR